MNILQILNELSIESKRTIKENILTKYKDNTLLKKVFFVAYNPDITFWISIHPNVEFIKESITLNDAIDQILENIASRKITGNNAINFYCNILESLSENDSIVIRRILDRDLRCGVGVPTINKIWNNLIPTYELMLAGGDIKHLQFPNVLVQKKFDGIRCLISHKETITLRTRNGNKINPFKSMLEDIKLVIPVGQTWDGELVCFKNNKELNRKESNGILNKAIRGTISEEESKLVKFMCWDIVDETQTKPYNNRLNEIKQILYDTNVETIKVVETVQVNCLEEITELFNIALENDEEGVIAKNAFSKWQPKRSNNLVKFKAELTADLIVVDWEEGLGKNVGKLGSLVCESSDGKIKVNVGTGFSDMNRNEFTKEFSLGKIVEVLYNAKIKNKQNSLESLYLPRFVKFRDFEKSTANSSSEIK